MQKFLLIIILSLNSALIFGQAEFGFYKGTKTRQPDNLPQMVVDRQEIDLGDVVTGKNQVVEITITNKGVAALVISDVFTGHGCYMEQRPAKTIRENESSVIRVRFTPYGTGAFKKSIVLTANVEGGTREIVIRGNTINP